MNWFQVIIIIFLEASGRRSRSGLRARVAWILHPELSERIERIERIAH